MRCSGRRSHPGIARKGRVVSSRRGGLTPRLLLELRCSSRRSHPGIARKGNIVLKRRSDWRRRRLLSCSGSRGSQRSNVGRRWHPRIARKGKIELLDEVIGFLATDARGKCLLHVDVTKAISPIIFGAMMTRVSVVVQRMLVCNAIADVEKSAGAITIRVSADGTLAALDNLNQHADGLLGDGRIAWTLLATQGGRVVGERLSRMERGEAIVRKWIWVGVGVRLGTSKSGDLGLVAGDFTCLNLSEMKLLVRV